MSLKAKLNAKARERGVASDPIRKQFAFALLYRRFFSVDGDQWMVLGGSALLLRTGGVMSQDFGDSSVSGHR